MFYLFVDFCEVIVERRRVERGYFIEGIVDGRGDGFIG